MSTGNNIDGKQAARILRDWVKKDIEQLKGSFAKVPGLAVIIVGADPASQIYVRNKKKTAIGLGMDSFLHVLPEDTSQEVLVDLILELNQMLSVNGILVQLPLPKHIDESTVISTIEPSKDVDGLHPINVGRLASSVAGMVPCTPLGCMFLLQKELGDISGKNAVVIGRSLLFGKPMAQLLLANNCTVTIAHSHTQDLPDHCQDADILIAAVGKPQLVKKSWVKPGSIVIDVGINRIITQAGINALVGDVDYNNVINVAAAVTPVPGGVGPMTIACLMFNTLRAFRIQNGSTDINLPTNI
ncbi:MAG: bifunctional methylenetetrahydrofolate dehydrogenase/methenyltetrahydrofolate cyclohydrolase FolD [Rhodospirillaceae bacterium]|nr:bifunctional methylenetetrahydrofolate dehydrogenase/methenyltetrahydrofolate cyclohydrolase FolD [Rhodospirillaceae bacterium]